MSNIEWGISVFIPLLIVWVVGLKKDKKIYLQTQLIKWRFKDVLVVLFLLSCLSFELSFAALVVKIPIIWETFYFLSLGVIYLFIIRKYSLEIDDLGFKKKDLTENLNVGLRISSVWTIVFLFLRLLIEKPPNNILFDQKVTIFLYLFSSILIGPFVEELFFRGIIYPAFKTKMREDIAIFWSSLVFAAYHGIYQQLLGTMILGILNANVYERTKSLPLCILIHSIINATSCFVILIYFYHSKGLINSYKTPMLWVILVAGIFFIVLQSIASRNKKLLNKDKYFKKYFCI